MTDRSGDQSGPGHGESEEQTAVEGVEGDRRGPRTGSEHDRQAPHSPPAPGAGSTHDGDGTADQVQRCDYCRLPISNGSVELRKEEYTYSFCSEGCREALEDADRVFTQYHAHRRTPTGVDPIDESLPQGIPRNSFLMLTDLAGTRTEAVRAELVWRALERGEPAVMLSFLEPPVSVVQEFVTLDWNVLPYLESGQLGIVDAFTYRMDERERMYERLNEWNAHLSGFSEGATQHVRDPSDIGELQNRIDDALETRDMVDRGIVVVDSLNEFGSQVQPVQAYRFVKDLRATVPKSRFVPVYASGTVSNDKQGFPHDLDYMVDGIVEMQLNEELVQASLIKQMRVRKMSGVLSLPKWVAYEYTAGDGIVTIDVPGGQAAQGSQGNGGGASGDAPEPPADSSNTQSDPDSAPPDSDAQPQGTASGTGREDGGSDAADETEGDR